MSAFRWTLRRTAACLVEAIWLRSSGDDPPQGYVTSYGTGTQGSSLYTGGGPGRMRDTIVYNLERDRSVNYCNKNRCEISRWNGRLMFRSIVSQS